MAIADSAPPPECSSSGSRYACSMTLKKRITLNRLLMSSTATKTHWFASIAPRIRLLVLILAVAQLPTLLVLGPIVIYVFSTASMFTAVLFTIWSVFVGLCDNFLKPILLGRGVQVPMVIVFIGAIGGFINSGIIGLFIGAIVFVVGYQLFLAWLRQKAVPIEELNIC